MKRGVRGERSVNNDTLDPRLGGVVKAASLQVTLGSLQVTWAASLREHGIQSPKYKRWREATSQCGSLGGALKLLGTFTLGLSSRLRFRHKAYPQMRLYDLCICPSATLPTCKEVIQEHKSSLSSQPIAYKLYTKQISP